MSSEKIIIVGGNAAGPAAAAKAKRVAPDAEVELYEAGPFISTGTCELPYVLSGHIKDYKKIVFFNSDSFYKKKGVKVFTEHFVEAIDKRRKFLIVKNTSTNKINKVNYDKLILTTGSKPVQIKDLSLKAANIFNFKTVSDLLQIKNYIKNTSSGKVLIIGAGYIGMEAAEAFFNLGYNVTVVEKKSLPMPSSEIEIQHLIFSELEKNGITFYGDADIKFIEDNNAIQSVKINGRIIEFDFILNAAGSIPNNLLAISAGIKIGKFGGIIVDNKQRTNVPNIFAAGDNTESNNYISGKSDYMPLATFAQKQGHIAGANAAGGNEFISPLIKNIAVKIFNNSYVSVGLTENEAKTLGIICNSVSTVASNLVKVVPESRKIFGKIIFARENKKILGASFLGGNEAVGYGNLISSLILQKTNAEILSEISYNYTPPLSPFINILSILGRKIKEV